MVHRDRVSRSGYFTGRPNIQELQAEGGSLIRPPATKADHGDARAESDYGYKGEAKNGPSIMLTIEARTLAGRQDGSAHESR